MKVISLASITCDHETEMLILTMYFKNYLKVFETVKYLGKYLNTNILIQHQIQLQILLKIFKYFQIHMYLTPCMKCTNQVDLLTKILFLVHADTGDQTVWPVMEFSPEIAVLQSAFTLADKV